MFEGPKLGHGRAVLANRDALALGNGSKQLGKMGLGLMDIHSSGGCFRVDPPYGLSLVYF